MSSDKRGMPTAEGVAKDALESLYAATSDIKSLEDALLVLISDEVVPMEIEGFCESECTFLEAESVVNLVRKIRAKRGSTHEG